MKIKITNSRNPAELQIVFDFLEKQGRRPRTGADHSITCQVPNEQWFKEVKQAVEFMTGCLVSQMKE